MAKTKSLADLFVNLLKDMYYAEKQIVKTLPKLAKHADSAELRKAFEHHLKETEGQVQRLEQVFALCDLKPVGKTCPAIKGILEEGDEDIKEAGDPDVLDAGMIADAQAVEHYEIARYGTMIAWAEQLGMKEAVPLLQQTLDQEYNADQTLTKIAESSLKSAGCRLIHRDRASKFSPDGAGFPRAVSRLCLKPCKSGASPLRVRRLAARRFSPPSNQLPGEQHGSHRPRA